jgi:hypothetical protein
MGQCDARDTTGGLVFVFKLNLDGARGIDESAFFALSASPDMQPQHGLVVPH